MAFLLALQPCSGEHPRLLREELHEGRPRHWRRERPHQVSRRHWLRVDRGRRPVRSMPDGPDIGLDRALLFLLAPDLPLPWCHLVPRLGPRLLVERSRGGPSPVRERRLGVGLPSQHVPQPVRQLPPGVSADVVHLALPVERDVAAVRPCRLRPHQRRVQVPCHGLPDLVGDAPSDLLRISRDFAAGPPVRRLVVGGHTPLELDLEPLLHLLEEGLHVVLLLHQLRRPERRLLDVVGAQLRTGLQDDYPRRRQRPLLLLMVEPRERQPRGTGVRACQRKRTAAGDRRAAVLLASSPMYVVIRGHVFAAIVGIFPFVLVLVPVRHDVHALIIVDMAVQLQSS
uniref:Uncharacterized protein n=1 Tax=Arundo donax TaxID=35708 RepID=A0A0A9DAC1_ARUDO